MLLQRVAKAHSRSWLPGTNNKEANGLCHDEASTALPCQTLTAQSGNTTLAQSSHLMELLPKLAQVLPSAIWHQMSVAPHHSTWNLGSLHLEAASTQVNLLNTRKRKKETVYNAHCTGRLRDHVPLAHLCAQAVLCHIPKQGTLQKVGLNPVSQQTHSSC
mmetsp:Transcript_15180/g.27668  ORF Transcript_15180/g.27668 Transcript_15180/m.27668 type:complete len:160 (-) Transcript_15180:1216-1695(-)